MSEGCSDENVSNDMRASFAVRLRGLELQLTRLLDSPVFRFRDLRHNDLPKLHGIYRIFDPTQPQETVRAGRTKTAGRGLRQRVYQNHLIGNQAGNLRAQLVDGRVCSDLDAAKQFVREYLAVQILVVEDAEERTSLEHFMLAILRPRYSD